MLIRSTPSSPADSKTSDPIACRALWLVQLTRLRYTPLKPPRHLYIVANKRCLLSQMCGSAPSIDDLEDRSMVLGC